MTTQLDHIMYAVSNLDAGIEEVEALTGIRATYGGSHPGAGTCNALLSFDNNQYLEIIAPDDEQDLAGTMGEELKAQTSSGIRMWAVAVNDYQPVQEALKEFGFGSNIIDMSRTRPDGVKLEWQILFVLDHSHGLLMPFFINWLDSPHPAVDAPHGCNLIDFAVQTEKADEYRRFCDALDLDVEVTAGEPAARARLATPKGGIILS